MASVATGGVAGDGGLRAGGRSSQGTRSNSEDEEGNLTAIIRYAHRLSLWHRRRSTEEGVREGEGTACVLLRVCLHARWCDGMRWGAAGNGGSGRRGRTTRRAL
eukprot:3028589-Rhodomonas_salina.3